ncbi:nucleotidyl transferase AbiEii/AbiGii toxin family protein [Streptomyces sp. NPDC029216]|uniref:nucleotidyl transferase AbiEii/AbiGii toxin family protein n=1 Tax=Streptomyces sp. NPDC029216 TaxID=3154701 RepID=UPI0033D86D25
MSEIPDLGPVLHLDDLAAAKTGALFGRAEARDAIDVNALLKAGCTRARLLELAVQNEAEPSLDEYVSALARVGRGLGLLRRPGQAAEHRHRPRSSWKAARAAATAATE